MKRLLLVLDIGNTNTVLGVYDGNNLVNHWRISSKKHRTVDECGIIIKELFLINNIPANHIKHIAISCVVPPLIPTLTGMAKKYFSIEPMIIGPGTKTGMPILYENPKEVGADRIVNAVAAYHTYKRSLIIVDFGTAITFDAVSEKGEYMGGVICPGISIAIDALFEKSARLPRVELSKPKFVIGKTTVESIRSGAIYGTAALVDGVVNKMKKDMKTECKAIATGGMADIIAAESHIIEDVLPFLTLEGLKILFERNR